MVSLIASQRFEYYVSISLSSVNPVKLVRGRRVKVIYSKAASILLYGIKSTKMSYRLRNGSIPFGNRYLAIEPLDDSSK